MFMDVPEKPKQGPSKILKPASRWAKLLRDPLQNTSNNMQVWPPRHLKTSQHLIQCYKEIEDMLAIYFKLRRKHMYRQICQTLQHSSVWEQQ